MPALGFIFNPPPSLLLYLAQTGGELLKPMDVVLQRFFPPSLAFLPSSLIFSLTTAPVLFKSGCRAKIAMPHLKVRVKLVFSDLLMLTLYLAPIVGLEYCRISTDESVLCFLGLNGAVNGSGVCPPTTLSGSFPASSALVQASTKPTKSPDHTGTENSPVGVMEKPTQKTKEKASLLLEFYLILKAWTNCML